MAALAREGFAHDPGPGGKPDADVRPFSRAWLAGHAAKLARTPFSPPRSSLPRALTGLTYDQYRDIRFRPDRAIWGDGAQPFQLQLFHGGYLYQDPVELFIVADGAARRLRYTPDMFSFGPLVKHLPDSERYGLSGFRIHTPSANPGTAEEYAVFQGASYFRGRAEGQSYGLSARGLAIDTVQETGEEFPLFRAFWIETPRPGATGLTVHALLDSPRTTGAYSFVIAPGDPTVMDVACTLYPRRTLTHAGIAPLTSMFFFGSADHSRWDDFRLRVHDSEGLLIHNGNGEWLWRPLIAPAQLQYSVFADNTPQGFGLMQRTRDFADYQDLAGAYEKRPSLWVEPVGPWGKGGVHLVELPTNNEYMDNIVAFWQPAEPLRSGAGHSYRYRLHWCWDFPAPDGLARVVQTRVGDGLAPGSRLMLIDYAGGVVCDGCSEEHLDVRLSASAGEIRAYSVAQNPAASGKRIGIQYHPQGAAAADLRCDILHYGKRTAETWMYRWAL